MRPSLESPAGRSRTLTVTLNWPSWPRAPASVEPTTFGTVIPGGPPDSDQLDLAPTIDEFDQRAGSVRITSPGLNRVARFTHGGDGEPVRGVLEHLARLVLGETDDGGRDCDLFTATGHDDVDRRVLGDL